jgi:TonB-linked SusC/RagA family outer membrane protein
MNWNLDVRIESFFKSTLFMNQILLREMRFSLLLLSAMFFSLNSGFSQSITLSGKILDGESENGLIGTTVMEIGTTNGAVADNSGAFTLEVDGLPVALKVSFIGYLSQNISVTDNSPLIVRLQPDAELVDEVLVVGYGRQKKKVSTGSISKVESKDIEGIAVPDVISTLEGQTTGLLINESSGQPGAGKTILIRGISTNGDNTPLYILDGLQVGNIDNVNPSDVESIDVLKDAASSAIYGARAANGVVIVTTKSGSGKDAGSITYSTSNLNSRPWKLPEMLGAEDYVLLMREKFANSGQTAALNALGFPDLGDALSHDTNWMNEIFNPAQVVNHRITATGKNSFLSIDYWNQNGVIGGEKSNYERYALRYNSSKSVKGILTVGQNLYLNRTDNNNIGTNSAFGGVQSDAFAYDPITPVYSDEGQYGFAQSPWVQKEYINPLSRLWLMSGDGKSDQILGNIYLEAEVIEGLRVKTDIGFDLNWWDYRNFTPTYEFHPAASNLTNDVGQGSGNFQGIQWENTANYTKTVNEKHNFDFLIGSSYRANEYRQVGGSTSNIPGDSQFNPNFQYIDAGQDTLDLTFGGASVDYALISTFSRLLYNFDEKYLFSATIRRDGSSNFGENNRFGVFPSVSAGWVASNEDFMEVFEDISFLKIRASWGVNGSDRIAPLSYVSRVENAFSYSFGSDEQTLNTGSAMATPANPDVKWEESEQIDLGIELGLFNDKLSIEADVYRKTTRDLLMTQLIPGYIGATNNPTSNLGEIRNEGIELAVTYKTAVRDLNITTQLNYTHFTNEVINVAGETGFLNGWSWPVRNTPISRMSEGYAVGHFIGYETDGIFQNQGEIYSHINGDGDLLQPNAEAGDIKFLDSNGDGVINSDDISDIGNPWPKHIFGFSTNLEYKGFYLNAIFNAQLGHDIYRTYERSDVTFSNYQSFWMDRWTPEAPSAELPRLTSIDPNNNQRPSDFYVEKGNFLRLRNLQIGCSLPKRWIEKAKMQEVKVYITTNNLFTITNYRGFDPDIGTSGWILDTGIDKGFYPNNRSIGVGINVTL